ncbi:hypothetical protein TNCV_3905261 [Trichonephila clavipes]|nr:hypothetical protein TNCV_3905261 [Trichonephila clavipes]
MLKIDSGLVVWLYGMQKILRVSILAWMLLTKLNPSTGSHRQSSRPLGRKLGVKITCGDWYPPIWCRNKKRYQFPGNALVDDVNTPSRVTQENIRQEGISFCRNGVEAKVNPMCALVHETAH